MVVCAVGGGYRGTGDVTDGLAHATVIARCQARRGIRQSGRGKHRQGRFRKEDLGFERCWILRERGNGSAMQKVVEEVAVVSQRMGSKCLQSVARLKL